MVSLPASLSAAPVSSSVGSHTVLFLILFFLTRFKGPLGGTAPDAAVSLVLSAGPHISGQLLKEEQRPPGQGHLSLVDGGKGSEDLHDLPEVTELKIEERDGSPGL